MLCLAYHYSLIVPFVIEMALADIFPMENQDTDIDLNYADIN